MKVTCRLHGVCAAFVLIFIYMIPPRLHAQGLVLSQMSPSSGSSGTIVIISGEKFGLRQGQSSVRFGGVGSKVREWSENALAVEVPAAVRPGSVDVLVTINLKEGHPGTFTVTQATATGPAKPAFRASTTPQVNDAFQSSQTAPPNDDPADAAATAPQNTPSKPTQAQPNATPVKEPSPVNPTPNFGPQSEPVGLMGKQPQKGTDQAPQSKGASAVASSITEVKPASGVAGTIVTITGTGFGQDSEGKSTVKFGNTVANVVQGKWSNTSITVSAPDLHVAGEPNPVNLSVQDENGNVLASWDAAFTENPKWGDLDERPLDIKFVGGYEEGFQSSQAATSDAFLAIYGRRLFDNDHIGPYFAARLQTAPQASDTYNVFSVFSNPSGKISTSDLNSVGSAVDLSVGMEWQFKKFDASRTTLSLITGTGFITPLQSNSIAETFTMPPFGTVECTELQGRLSRVLSGPSYKGIVANTAAGSSSCFSNTLNANSTATPPVAPTPVTLLEYAVPDTPNFFPKYSIGLRIVNRYAGTTNGSQSCLEESPCERGYVDFTLGQSAALTGGSLKHTVFTIDSIHPLPVPNVNFLYLFGSVSKRFYHLPREMSPVVLQSGTAATAPDAATLIIPLTQPDRDFYRIGVGVDITKIFTALTGNSKSGQATPASGSKVGGQ